MLKPERVTFSADDDKFHQFANNDQLNSYLDNSLVHYSTDFQNSKQQQQQTTSIKHSNSLNELSAVTMTSQQEQQLEHDPPASAPPSLISEEVPILNENNLHQFDALTLQQLAIGSNQSLSNTNEQDSQRSLSHSTSLADIQKELDRVKQMKSNRTYSSPTSSLCSRLTINPFNGSNNNIDLSSITHSVHFNEQPNNTTRLPFSSTYITSIPESIVPASDSSSTNDNHFIPIDYIESPSLEDREVFETFHTKPTSIPGLAIRQSVNSLNRNISSSETDLIASLHRSASKQGLDNQSEHGTTYSGTSDDMIFIEWDKERNLFQDYINSLRTEIRVLLQERSEYQKQMETINNNLSEHKRLNLTQIDTDQSKLDLLQKSLEEKNFVLEQLQKEYELIKEKNTNLTRKISLLRCDAKSQTGVIDELKQKITELAVDIQNHILVKRRLEISMINLESDCKIIDAERLRLNNDVKETQFSKQELEKLLQQANVQIAEQGSTIGMLRSDNVQVRSQLSATQRRMLQEKQQVMDYLRQIENDLVEKEQIKQREAILRKDFDKLQLIHKQDRQEIDRFNLQINQDKQKLEQLEQERLQLLKTIQNLDDHKGHVELELDTYKSATKRLYTHFKIPFDSIQSIDQLIPLLEDRYRTEQISQAQIHHIPLVQSTKSELNETEDVHQLREDLTSMGIQLKQLDEANQAWQQYQQNQLITLRDRLKLTDMNNSSFDDIVQQIENRFNDLNNQLIDLQDVQKTNVDIEEIQPVIKDDARRSKDTQTEENEEYQLHETSLQNVVPVDNEELHQLREKLADLNTKYGQLDEANRAWQQYQQTQLDNFRNKLQTSLPIENSLSFDDIAQQILLHIDQAVNERESLIQQLQISEKLNNDFRSDSETDIQTIQQTYKNTINELNQQLILLKQQNDQLETEKHLLNQQLEDQSTIGFNQERNTPTSQLISNESKPVKKQTLAALFHDAPIHNVTRAQSASPLNNEHDEEIRHLRDNFALLTAQCAQLEQANQAWQLYQQTQLDNFRTKLQDYFPTDDSFSLDQAAQLIVDQVTKDKEDFTEQYYALEKENDDLRSASATNLDTINQLNQELLAMKEKDRQANELAQSESPRQLFEEIPTSSSAPVDDQEVEEIVRLRENLASLTAQLDETNRALQQYQLIGDQVTREREDFGEKYQALEKANDDLRTESGNNMESIRQSYVNTVNELNQELLAMKEAYEQIDSEKQLLNSELEKRSADVDQDRVQQSIQKVPSDLFKEVPIHTSVSNAEREAEEFRQLRENFAILTAQYAQLDEANRAWQLYQRTQLETFKNKLHDYLPVDENVSFDDMAQQIVDQITKEREDFSERYAELEQANNDLRSESTNNMESIQQSYINTVNELNQELLAMKEVYEQLDAENQRLNSELEKRSADADQQRVQQTIEKVPSDLFKEVPIHTSGSSSEREAEELRQLRENFAVLTAQYAQLDEANRAWQLYQETQLETFKTKLHDYLPFDQNVSFDDIAQQIVDQITSERNDSSDRYAELQQANNNLRSESTVNMESIQQSYINTVNELNQELLAMKESYEQLHAEKQLLNSQLEKQTADAEQDRVERTIQKVPSDLFKQPFKEVPIHTSGSSAEREAEELQQLREKFATLTAQYAQLDEANRAWQLYQVTQLETFKNKLHDYLPVDENVSFDDMAQQIADQITKERENSAELERANGDLRSESSNNLESIRQSYVNTVNELNQELFALKEAYEQLDAEKRLLNSQLEKQSIDIDQDRIQQSIQKVPSDLFKSPFKEVPIHASGSSSERDAEELRQLRENFAVLTAQYAQLDEANRAWQLYQQTQLHNFRSKLHDYLPIDDSFSLDQAAQQIADQIVQERENFAERCHALEKANDDLRSESTNNLETIEQSYINTIDELNKELLAMRQLDRKEEILNSQLENRSIDLGQRSDKQTIESAPGNLSREVSIHTSSASVIEQETEEIHQLRENLAVLTAQCTQLNEVNHAWQQFHQSELDKFRTKLRDYLQLEDNFSFEQMAQQVVDQIIKEREDFAKQCQVLEKANNDLQSESVQESSTNSKELLAMKEQYAQVLREKEILINQIENRPVINNQENYTQTIESFDQNLLEQQTELDRLQENLVALSTQCAQLDETNRSWQQFERTQVDLLKNHFPFSNKTSLEEIIQEMISYMNQLTNEQDLWKEKELNMTKDFESMNDQYEQLKEYNKQLLEEKSLSNEHERQTNDNQREENLVSLQNQCTQLDNANQAWQSFYNNQIDLLKIKLKDYINFDHELNFDQIIQLIITQFEQKNQLIETIQLDSTKDDIDSLKKQLIDSQENEQLLNQEISTLQEECKTLEQQLKDNQYSIDSLTNNLQFLSNENEQLKQQYDEFQENNNLLINENYNLTNRLNELEKQSSLFEFQQRTVSPLPIDTFKQMTKKQTRHTPIEEAQIHTITPVQSVPSSNIEQETEEIQQLRINLASLTTQCSQLETANQAWQQFHQNQLEMFRHKLQNWILIDDNSNLEQIAQQVIIQLDQLGNSRENESQLESTTVDSMQKQLVNYQLNESILAQNLEQLNQKLFDVYRQCEEFREHNAQLILSKQEIEKQLEERDNQIKEFQLSNSNSEQMNQQLFNLQQHNDSLRLKKQNLQTKLNDMEQCLNNSTIQRIDSPRENVAIHNIDREREEEILQLRTDLATASAHCLQLEEANRAWQKYQYDQMESFRQKLQEHMPSFNHIENSSLDFIAQQTISYLNQLNIQRDDLIHQKDLLKEEVQLQRQQLERPGSVEIEKRLVRRRSHDKNIREAQIHNVSPVQSASPLINEHDEELRHLRDKFAFLTAQCAQLEQANQAWQIYQQTQLDKFRTKLQDYFPIDESFSLDQAAQLIVDQVAKDKEDFTEQYYALEKENDDLRSASATDLDTLKQSYVNTINQLNRELLVMKEKDRQANELAQSESPRQLFEEMPMSSSTAVHEQEAEETVQLRENLASLTAQLDETNRALQQYQQIADHVTREREDFSEKYQALEKANNDLRTESGNNMESIRQSYVNTVNELNQELLAMKEAYEQIDSEKQLLNSELEKRSADVDQQRVQQTIEKVPSQLFKEVPIHTSASSTEREAEEFRQLRENFVILTAQYAQLDEANRAWQLYQETQLETFKNKLHDYLPVDENVSFDDMAQQIVDQITKEREDFSERYAELEQANNDLRSESTNNMESIQQSYINTVNELNQELLAMKEAYEQLLNSQLEKRSIDVDQDRVQPSIQKVPSDLFKQPFKEVPIHSSGSSAEREAEELRQLRENFATLTAQYAQLDEANRAWQLYHQTQLDSFKNKLHDYLPVDENVSFDDIAQQVVDQITKEREDFAERYAELERGNNDLGSESTNNMESVGQSYINTINELNQELLSMKEAYEQLDAEKQLLNSQLERQTADADQERVQQTIEKIPSDLFKQPFQQVPIHTIGSSSDGDAEELRQLRENFTALNEKYAQLDEANRAWQLYQETQLDSFRNKLHDYLPVDDNVSFDDVAEQIIDQITKEREDFAERYGELKKINDDLQSVSDMTKLGELNEELVTLKNQYEELENINKQLLSEKEDLINQLNDRSIVVGHHSASELSPVEQETPAELKEESELQSIPTPVENEEIGQMRSDLDSITTQFAQLTQTNQIELDSFRNKLQNWISLSPHATLADIAQQLNDQFEQQQENIPQRIENQTQTIEQSEKVHIAIETTPLIYENHQTQIDPIDMIDQQIQTESFEQLWSNSDVENLFPSDEEDDRLNEYIDEISSLSSIDLSNRLNKECQQIFSKQKFKLPSFPNLELNHLALIAIYSLYNQHLTDEGKHLYNETLIRALKQEYELINNEKTDYIEKYNSLEETCQYQLKFTEKNFDKLQNKYDELLEHNELERLDSKQSINELIEKYEIRVKQLEFNLYNFHEENEKLKYDLNCLKDNYQTIVGKNYEKLESDYQLLRQDYNDLINENELLKDFNSKMYQEQLQETKDNDSNEIKSSNDVDIQCNLSEELQTSNTDEPNWTNDWGEERTPRQLPIQEQGLEQLSNEEEINRLKTIILNIQLENENLKDLNSELYQTKLQNSTNDSTNNHSISQSHATDIQGSLQPISVDSSVQTELEDEISPVEFPSNEPNSSSVIEEYVTKQTIDNETQTEEQSQEKLVQVNNRLKRALQSIKEKIHQAINERPELFPDTSDETIERLDHLISAIGNQAKQIDILQNERDHAQRDIDELQRSLQAYEDRLNNEDPATTEQLVSASSPFDDISPSVIDDYQKQIDQLQQNLSEKDEERILLRERLNEVELELTKTLDDRALTQTMYEEQFQSLVQERNALVEQHARHPIESQHEIEELAHFKQSQVPQHDDIPSNEDIKSLQQVIQQQADELRDVTEKYFALSSQIESQDELDRQKKENEERLNYYENQIENLIRENANLLEEIQKNVSPSSQTTDNEKSTDDQQHEKLVKLNTKLKRALQIFKEKIHRVVTERPDLFVNIGEETSERLDHLLSTVANQTTQIDILQAERNRAEEQLRNEIRELHSSLEACQYQLDNERPINSEQLVSAVPSPQASSDISPSIIEDYQKQISQLQQKLSQKDDERILLRERLNEVELELTKTLDDRALTQTMYEEQFQSVVQERNTLVEQQALQSIGSEHGIEQLQEMIEQQAEELKDLREKDLSLSSQLNSNANLQSEFDRQKKEYEARLNNYENQIEHLTHERTHLEEIQRNAPLPVQTTDNEKPTDDQQHEKLVKLNTKLKRALQIFKEKIHRVATERPDLFVNIGEETSERLDHLLSTVANQTTQIDILQAERNRAEEQLRNEIRELHSSLEACQYQLDNERPIKSEQLVSTSLSSQASSNISPSIIEDYQKHISQLHQKLSQNEDERSLLRERLNEVELEFRKTVDDRTSTLTMYEEQFQSLVQERNELVEQQVRHSMENQQEIEQLQQELAQLRQTPATLPIPSEDDIKSLYDLIDQQSEQLRDLNRKYIAVSSQLESQAELDRQKNEYETRLNNYENQIEHLTRERTHLLEEIQRNAPLPVQTTDNEKPIDDQQHEKLVKLNTKLKRALQIFKEKIHRLVTERPDLFVNIGEETSERLDHLISTVANQTTQIDILQTERNQADEQFRQEISELQSSFDIYRQQVDNEYRIKLNEHVSSSPLKTQKIETEITEYTQEIQPLQAGNSNDNQWNEWLTQSPPITDEEIQPQQSRDIDIQCDLLVDKHSSTQKLSDSNDNQEPTVTNRLFGFFKNVTAPWSEQSTDDTSTNDWDGQNSPIQFPSEEPLLQQAMSSPSSIQHLTETIKNKIQQIVSEYPDLFPHSNGDTLEVLNQFISIITKYQNKIQELQSSFDAYRYHVENEGSIRVELLAPNHADTQTLGLSMVEEHQKQIEELKEKLHQNELVYQREIERLVEERDQTQEKLSQLNRQLQETDNDSSRLRNTIASQTNFDDDSHPIESQLSQCQSQIDVLLRERVSLIEQINQLAHQPKKQRSEIQTRNDNEPSIPSDQRISRRVFEQEMLAWSKESEQLKQYVKQIQIENKKLTDIILKFETIIHDYMHENERLKQENQHLSFLSYSSIPTIDDTENLTSSDTDICYLTLKCLTYEVAQRISNNNNNNEQSLLMTDNTNDQYLKQRLNDTERQLKSIRIQNQRLKKQLETYTIQFKHIQHEMNIKIQELSTLKIEIERLRTSETQYRLEVDRLKADLQYDRVKMQQLERELADLKLERTSNDNNSTNNLRELLELKERELNALKEKLDYTIQAHQLELQEAIKSNQFSLDNVQRFEQLDQRHQEKRKELEIRLGKLCKIIRPLVDNQQSFNNDSIVDIEELQQLITDTEAEEKVTTSLGPIRDCLGLLESQMKELHHNLIENHARRSKQWKYKLGFECLSCDSQWEITHDVRDLEEACQDPNLFLESSRVEPMTGCSCPLIIDFIESDVRLCLDDILDEVIVRTTVK